MINIAIIGAGQLGSRHLQALANLKQESNIYVIDSNSESLSVAKERYEAVDTRHIHKLSYHRKIEDLPTTIDIVINAVTSNYRRVTIDELLKHADVRYIILEKWLFSSIEDAEIMTELINSANTKAWVNCSMRMMPVYEDIKAKLKSNIISLGVIGTNYGLITNLIHYVDFLAWYSKCTDFTVDTRGLISELVDSKRRGYKELFGNVFVEFANGSAANITCYKNGNVPHLIQIVNENMRYIIDEPGGIAHCNSSETNVSDINSFKFSIPYQSSMTTELVESLIETGTCKLPTFRESTKIHIQLMNPLIEFVKKEIGSKEKFPFT